MKRLLAVLAVAVISISLAPLGYCQTGLRGAVPSYYSLLDFNLTSPGAYSTAAGGFANPAAYRMLPGGELQYFWSDEDAKVRSLNRWGLFLGCENLGFSVIHSKMIPVPQGFARITDYRLSLAFGDRDASFGIGYGWSSGDEDFLGRTKVVQLGVMRRFGRFVSLGLAGAFSTSRDERIGLADVALRPLGDRALTIFGDMELDKNTRFKDALWSAGAMVEFMAGVDFIGRYFDDESFAVSVAFSFGHEGASVSSRFDKDSKLSHTNYGVRLGYNERNVIDTYINKDRAYLKMHLKGPIKYRRYKYFDESITFYDIISSLEDAKHDPRIKGVALNLSGAKISRAKVWEIREKLKELKHEGKGVVIFIDRAGMTLYHLASVADRIILDPDGDIELPGFIAGRTYLKNTLEKLGLGFDEWRFFKYKSAFETISRDSMSEADREQFYALIEDFYWTVREDITAARNVSAGDFDRWVNEVVIFTPAIAIEEGLVDKLGRWEDVKEVIKDLEGSGKKYISPGILAGKAYPSLLWGENPRVAVVYGLGLCLMDKGINARKLEKVFQHLRDDKRVKAVVFRVDSPGGDGMASDVVAAALQKCAAKKPVIVTQGDVAGSGGYWISMYGDTILAVPSTITGSIGVIGGWIWNKGLGEKLGMTSDHVKVGDHADLGFGIRIPFLGVRVPDRNLNEEEREKMEEYIKLFYDEFVEKVAKGRDMNEDDVREVAQGRIWSGLDGREKGLVDIIGGLDMAITIAREAAGLDEDEKVDIVQYPEMGFFDWSFLKKASPLPFSATASEETEFSDDYDRMFLKAIIESNGRPLYMVPPEALPRDNKNIWLRGD